MNKFKKAIAIGTTFATVLWSIGMVLPVGAVSIGNGDVVKTADSSACYYIQGSYKRVFPHEGVYFSWGYPDFSIVKTVTAAELAAYEDANPMPFRDGSLFRGSAATVAGCTYDWCKAYSVFYVEGATLKPVLSKDVYMALFKDASWSKVIKVPDDLLSKFNYPLGDRLSATATHPDGSLVRYAGETQKYLIADGKKRAISEAAFTANKYLEKNVIEIAVDEVYTSGDAITGTETALVTPGWSGISEVAALAVSLSDTPATDTIPGSATNVPLLKVRLAAGSSAVTVNGLTFKRSGVGAHGAWLALYLDEGSTRLTHSRTLTADTEEVEFATLSLAIPANSSKVIALKGDLDSVTNAKTSSEHAFSLTTVDTSATVTGLPANGNTMTVGSQDVSKATIKEGVGPSDPSVGQQAAEIATFEIEAGDNDISVSQLVVTFSGTLSSSNVSNLNLYDQDGTLMASVASIGRNDRATFTFDSPYTINDGIIRNFSIKADLEGRVNDTLSAYIEEKSHLNATDIKLKRGADVDNTAVDTASESNEIKLKGGDITMVASGPAVGIIAKNGNDLVLLNFSLTSTRNVTVKNLGVGLTINKANLATDDLLDLKVKDADTGSTLQSKATLGAKDTLTKDGSSVNWFTLTEDFDLSANTTRHLSVTIDTANTDTVENTVVKASIRGYDGSSTDSYFKDISLNDYILTANVVPDTINGKNRTVEAASLTVIAASLPASDEVVKGAKLVPSFGLILTAGDASNLSVKKILAYVKTYDTKDGDSAYNDDGKKVISKVGLYEGNTLLKESNLGALTGGENKLTFDGLNLTVIAGNSKTLTLKADTLDSIANNYQYYINVKHSDGDDIIAYDANGVKVEDSVTTGGTNAADVVITVTSTGGLSAAKDANTPDSSIIVMGSTSQVISKIKFTAVNEAFTISKLTVKNRNSTTDRAISSIDLSWLGGSHHVGGLAGGKAPASGLSIVVPKNDILVLTISANLNTYDAGAVSADKIELGLGDDTNEFKAVGNASGEDDNDIFSGTTLYGNPMYVRRTKPTVSAAEYNGILGNKQMDLITFAIKADKNEDVALKRITFDYSIFDASSGGNKISDLELYRGGTKIEDIENISNISNTTSTTATLAISWKDNKEEVISADQTNTYVLKGLGVGFAEDDSFAIRIAKENNTDADELENYDGLKADTYFIWSDYYKGATHHSAANNTTEKDWCAGVYVKTLPSNWSSWTK